MVWVPVALSRDIPKNTNRTLLLEGSKLTVERAHRTIRINDIATSSAYAATETGGMIWLNPDGMTQAPPVFLAGLSIVSLAIASDLPTVLRLLGNPTPQPDAQVVEVSLDGVALLVGWHVPETEKIVLHVTSTDPGNVESKALVALHHLRAAAEAASRAGAQ